ncbi:MAG: holo-ACP synthase [Anaerolineales bacterium]
MLRTGVDLVEIKRIEGTVGRHGDRFLQRVYTPHELAEVKGNYASLAARFAAKEAVSKALGCGIGTVGWHEIEVRRGPANRPILHLYGAAQDLARELGLEDWSLSLSHSTHLAIAFVVASGDN